MANYSGTMTENDWLYRAQQDAAALTAAIMKAYDDYKKQYAAWYNMTDAQVQTLIGASTLQEVTDMRALFTTFNDFYAALNNGAVATADRLTILLNFV